MEKIPSVCPNRNSIACKSQGNETFCLAVSRHGPMKSARGVRCMDPRRVYASISSSLKERQWTSPRDMRLKPASRDMMSAAERTRCRERGKMNECSGLSPPSLVSAVDIAKGQGREGLAFSPALGATSKAVRETEGPVLRSLIGRTWFAAGIPRGSGICNWSGDAGWRNRGDFCRHGGP